MNFTIFKTSYNYVLPTEWNYPNFLLFQIATDLHIHGVYSGINKTNNTQLNDIVYTVAGAMNSIINWMNTHSQQSTVLSQLSTEWTHSQRLYI
jgi:hypothetical protein